MSKRITKTEEVALTKCYLILKPTSVHIPGDERSRTNPGHGYGPETKDSWNIWSCGTREEWQSQIKAMTKKKEDFVPLIGERPLIATEVLTILDGTKI